jgi:hypothetical protein
MEMADFHSKTLNRTFPTIIFSPGLLSADSDKTSFHGDAVNKTAQATQQVPAAPAADSFAAAVAREENAPATPVAVVPAQTSGGSSGAIVPFSEIAVEKVDGENGYTIEEIFTKAKDLSGKKVKLRGKVVKFSPNIMGRNWVHLQDGTGNPMNNTHDLVVTTNEIVNDDQIVIFEGTLTADKDFGAGYKYEAIVEEAKLIK